MKKTILVLTLFVLAGSAMGQQMIPDRMISVVSNANWEILSTEDTLHEVIEKVDEQVNYNRTNATAAIAADAAARAVIAADLSTVSNDLDAVEVEIDALQAENKTVAFLGGLNASYNNTTKINLSEGAGYCGTNYFYSTVAVEVTCSGIGAGIDFYYIYVDDDASTYPASPTFIASTTEPTETFSASQIGWYNGNDRCVAAVKTESSAITDFRNIEQTYYPSEWKQLASDLNPGANWLAMDDILLNTIVPVNVESASIWAKSEDSGSDATVKLSAFDEDTVGTAHGFAAYWTEEADSAIFYGWVSVGDNVTLLVGAESDDDAGSIDVWYNGYRIKR